MKKVVSVFMCLTLLVSFALLAGCGSETSKQSTQTSTTNSGKKEIKPGLKIGYFVSALDNGFHQATATYAKKYAKEKYGAEVLAFDGKSDAKVMAQNFKRAIEQGINMATAQIWQAESITADAQAAIKKGIAITSYFDKIPGVNAPLVLPGEAQISEEMGKIAAEQWKKAHPDTPITVVCIGWPDNEVVKTGRTDPFIKGVMSVDPTAKSLGCIDGSKGADDCYKLVQDLIQANPGLNIIYSEAADLTVGVIPALQKLGRGTMANGVPQTEIVCSVDCPENEIKQIFDPNSSLKMSMALPVKATAQVRIDTCIKVYTGELTDKNAKDPIFIPNKLIGYWNLKPEEAVSWYNNEWDANFSLK
jgi:ABC-type sugar transport system substrate-binding protein